MLQGLCALEAQSPEGHIPEFLRTHPSTKSRVQVALKLAEEAAQRVRDNGHCDAYQTMFRQAFQLGGGNSIAFSLDVPVRELSDAEWGRH